MNGIKTVNQFVEAVRIMRVWQKEYARTNSPLSQKETKDREALVDAAIEARDARLAGEKQPCLPGLPGGAA